MIGKHWCLVCALILSLLAGPGARAQAPTIPPDIQTIFNKMKSGQSLTEAEKTRIHEWSDSIKSKPAAGTAGAGKNSSASAAPAAASPSQSSTPCPPASASLIAAAAPTRAEYVALVKSLAETYGKGLGTHRAEFDRIFAEHSPSSSPAQSAGVLYMSGAAGASVYASAVAAAANPDDLQVASNLGVALDTIPDAKAASAVLLYARKLAPQQALPALNLAWVYFNSGHAADAKVLFQSAAVLDPHPSGPSAGLGMLANCSGDTATAMSMFRKSLSKSYSGVVAVGFEKAQKAQEQQQQQQNSTEPPPSFPPSGDADSSPLPELPATADPQETLGSIAAFQQAKIYADKATQAASARLQDANARVLALIRHRQIDPDGTIDLPRLFDKQLFEFRQILKLTISASLRGTNQPIDQAFAAITTASKNMETVALAAMPQFEELDREIDAAQQRSNEDQSAAANAGHNEAARIAAMQRERDEEARIAVLRRQEDEINDRLCKLNKQVLETEYAQYFKLWKQLSDTYRAATRDFYAYSQPIIDQIWVPALNQYVQSDRELSVLTLYTTDALYANSLAEMARVIKNLKCVEPEPPKPAGTVKDPTLTQKGPDCPLNPPLNVNLGAFKMELGCDHVKISGGEILRVEVERNFIKKYTAYSVGLGVAASLPSISLGGGGSLGDNGKSWSPPGTEAKFSANAQIMAGVRVNDSGGVEELSLKSTVQASGSAGPLKGAIGLSGTATISLENGVNTSVTPILNGSAGK